MLSQAQGESFLEEVVRLSEKRQRVFNDSHMLMPDFDGKIEYITSDIITSQLKQVAALNEGMETSADKPELGKLIPSPEMKWPDVYVADHDPLVLAWNLMAKKNYTPLVVFNACNTNRGGGAKEGAAHIEAELCRRTNYYKALKTLKNESKTKWPLQEGSVIHAQGVAVFKNSRYKLLDAEFTVDLMGVVFPKRPDAIGIDGRECYEKEIKFKKVSDILNFIVSATPRRYDALILYHLGTTPDIQPQDDFISIVNRAVGLNDHFQRIYYLQPAGGMNDMEDKDRRWNFIKYCHEIDTANPVERDDCVEPPPDELILTFVPKKSKKKKRVIRREKKNADFDETATFDDNKSIAYLSSSGDEE